MRTTVSATLQSAIEKYKKQWAARFASVFIWGHKPGEHIEVTPQEFARLMGEIYKDQGISTFEVTTIDGNKAQVWTGEDGRINGSDSVPAWLVVTEVEPHKWTPRPEFGIFRTQSVARAAADVAKHFEHRPSRAQSIHIPMVGDGVVSDGSFEAESQS